MTVPVSRSDLPGLGVVHRPRSRARHLTGLALTGIATGLAAPLARRSLVRLGAMDVANHRSSHTDPVPRGGGLAALVGCAVGMTVLGRATPRSLVGLGMLATAGFADDLRSKRGGVPASHRLAAQITAGTLLAGPGGQPWASLGGALTTTGVVNVVNFMDGINGISGMTAVVWGLNAMAGPVPDTAAVGALAAGAGLGFLPWNVPRAQLFLGDVGSYLFGGLMATGMLSSLGKAGRLRGAIAVGAPLLPYAADAAQALIRHRLAGGSLTEPHRDHVYQRLVDEHRLTHVQVAGAHAGVAALNAIAWRRCPAPVALATSGAVCAGWIALPDVLRRKDSV